MEKLIDGVGLGGGGWVAFAKIKDWLSKSQVTGWTGGLLVFAEIKDRQSLSKCWSIVCSIGKS